MHEVLNLLKQHPSQKLHKNFINSKKPQSLSKNKNLYLDAWNEWRMRDKEIIPSDLRQEKAENLLGMKFGMSERCLGGEKTRSSRERSRKWDLKSQGAYI